MRAIDADVLLKEIKAEVVIYGLVERIINRQPTISPDSLVKRGRWEYYEGSTMVNPHFRCSVCGRPRYEHYAVNDFKFCPSCGALMED